MHLGGKKDPVDFYAVSDCPVGVFPDKADRAVGIVFILPRLSGVNAGCPPLFGGGYYAVIYKSKLDKAASDIGCNVHFPVTFFRTAKDFLRVRGFLSVIGFNTDGEAVISGQPCRDGVGLMTADEEYGFPGYGMKRAVVTVPSGFRRPEQ